MSEALSQTQEIIAFLEGLPENFRKALSEDGQTLSQGTMLYEAKQMVENWSREVSTLTSWIHELRTVVQQMGSETNNPSLEEIKNEYPQIYTLLTLEDATELQQKMMTAVNSVKPYDLSRINTFFSNFARSLRK